MSSEALSKVLLFWWKNKGFKGNKSGCVLICMFARLPLSESVQCADSTYKHISPDMSGKSGLQ